jgi:hypothetical protein
VINRGSSFVTATSRSTAKVMLLIDHRRRRRRSQRSRSRGIVRSAHGDDLIFEFVVRDGVQAAMCW